MFKKSKPGHLARIAIIGAKTTNPSIGGIENHCHHLAQWLSEQGYRVDMYVQGRDETDRSLAEIHPTLQVHYCAPLGHASLFRPVNAFIALCLAAFHRPDVVHLHGLNSSLFLPIARLLALTTVFTLHSDDYRYPKWGRFVKKIMRLAERSSSFAERVICVSQELAQTYQQRYQKSVSYIPNGIDLDKIKQYSLSGNYHPRPFLLVVARITPEKRIKELVRAHQRSNTHLDLIILGGVGNQRYLEEVQALGNEKCIIKSQVSHDQVVLALQNCALFLNFSSHEGLPIAVLEAIFLKAPILLSDIPGHKQLRLSAQHYVESEDALIEKLSSLRDCESLRIQTQEEQRLFQEYDMHSVFQSIEALYQDAVKR